jgi:hypothetical protein
MASVRLEEVVLRQKGPICQHGMRFEPQSVERLCLGSRPARALARACSCGVPVLPEQDGDALMWPAAFIAVLAWQAADALASPSPGRLRLEEDEWHTTLSRALLSRQSVRRSGRTLELLAPWASCSDVYRCGTAHHR